ncbi:hypothetical protein PoB_000303900 [Plakobranchus ocellatus]|uniref:Uncharacterized protein n=1 Tax=Plakobranchus ocellatus TaxID=259542 RepID=A0AAV3Y2T7_9GAST|nr:hypothetical protein PoB_000303900 [Plakobranchus ocellatus]
MEVSAVLVCSRPKKLEYFKTCIVGDMNCCLQCALDLSHLSLPKHCAHNTFSLSKSISRIVYKIASKTVPQQGDLRHAGTPSGQDAGGGTPACNRRVPEDLRADLLATVPPTPP